MPAEQLDVRLLEHPALSWRDRLLLDALEAELAASGVRARRARTGYPDDVGPGTVFVVLAPDVLQQAVLRPPGERPDLLARCVLVLTDEQIRWAPVAALDALAAGGAVLATQPATVRHLRRHGIDAATLRLGGTPAWRRVAPPTHDVGAVGTATDHRSAVLAHAAPVLARSSAVVRLDDGSIHAPELADGPASVLRSGRVALLVPGRADEGFDQLAATYAMAHGVAVVAARSPGLAPFRPGVHLLTSAPPSLPAVLAELLDDGPDRQELADAATAWLVEHPMAAGVDELVDRCVELTGRPVPRAGRRLPAALPPRPFEPASRFGSFGEALAMRALRELKLDLTELRRGQHRAELAQAGVDDPGAVLEVHRSPAHAAASPRVSVVIALHQHATEVVGALTSLACSTFEHLEVVVVDDGSTDGSGDAVATWSAAHPELPLLLCRHQVNRGLGAARNTAVARARGELVFVLDADNEVLPTGIAALVRALDADSRAAMAYGLLACFDEHGPNGTLSNFDWEPARLRQGNYIDAMALVRRQVLDELGGYTTDRRLYAWEDYDLWCGLAERGERAVMVPNFVARYRRSPTSMVSVANYSHHAAFAALVERHPTLMAGIVPPE